MKIIAAILLALHGLIHLLGFVKGFGFKEIKELTLPISKTTGLIWLMAAILVLGYATLFLAQSRYAWVLGLLAAILSQVLVFAFWKDAKFGTIPNLLILALSVMAFGTFQFQHRVREETSQLLASAATSSPSVLAETDLQALPIPVQRWIRASGAVGKPKTRVGHIVQQVAMKMKPDQDHWMNAEAFQYTTLDPPAFIWTVDAKMNAFLYFLGRDQFQTGKGEMLIQLNSLVPIVDAHGDQINESSLQRFLGEMVWFPSMAVQPYISWEAVDDSTARATMRYQGSQGSGLFYFNGQGEVVRYSAMRYKDPTPDSPRYEWVMDIQGYQTFEGVKVPAQMTATWKLPEGDWTWLKLELADLKYDENAPQ